MNNSMQPIKNEKKTSQKKEEKKVVDFTSWGFADSPSKKPASNSSFNDFDAFAFNDKKSVSKSTNNDFMEFFGG